MTQDRKFIPGTPAGRIEATHIPTQGEVENPHVRVRSNRKMADAAPTFPGLRQILGATTVDRGRPYAFVVSSNSDLWVNWWSGSNWKWSSHGVPPELGLKFSGNKTIGAITVDGSRPYLFVRGEDHNLWVHWWSGSDWTWSNQGTPLTGLIGEVVGVIAVDGSRPYLFSVTHNEQLWVHWWSGSDWTWSLQGEVGPFVASMGAVTVDGSRPFAFFVGRGNNLWVHWETGDGWAWMDLGLPPTATITRSVGAVAVDGRRPYVFAVGSDNNLWVCWASSIGEQYVATWNWSNQECPPTETIVAPVGVTLVDGGRPYAFVIGSEGNLWVNWWSGTAWHWDNQGHPLGVGIYAEVTPITVDDGRPYVFVRGSDNGLWLHWWTGTEWRWDPMN